MLDHIPSRVTNLLFNAALAAELPGLNWARGVFGERADYENLPPNFVPEFSADLARGSGLLRRARALSKVPLYRWRTDIASGPLQDQGAHQGPLGTERWYFMNGILADATVAQQNAVALGTLVRRPITVWYNTTKGLVPDLVESAIGKSFERITEAADANIEAFVQVLCDNAIDRIIFISHSQGTIVTSVMLKTIQEWLAPPAIRGGAGAQKLSRERYMARKLSGNAGAGEQPKRSRRAEAIARAQLQPAHLARLECYCFANCATSLTPVALTGQLPRHTPWLESYGNEFDLVARLGLLAPPHGIGGARIEGDRYRRDHSWGHLLNVHYLAALARELQRGGPGAVNLVGFPENLQPSPRFLEYIGGAAPPAAYP